ncbi:MAG: oligosaccharide flippase family protein [Hyphomonas sp.]|nr:oligosaccharide flippase family protein [Hyphomonas sp.]
MPDQDLPHAHASPRGGSSAIPAPRWGTTTGFAGSVAKLASGQLIAMIVPIMAAPILGRLYDPSEYGVFALYVAFATILAVFATLQFQHAIIAEKRERLAVQLVQLCAITALTVAGFGLLFFGTITLLLSGQDKFSELRGWLFLLPFSMLLLGLMASIGALANRKARYGSMAAIQVLTALTTVLVAIMAGNAGWGASGLLAGYVSGQVAGAGSYLVLYRQLAAKTPRASLSRLIALSRRYRKFPIYTLPSELLGIFNQQMPVLALSVLGATALTGSFSRALQLVAAPITLIGMAVGQVFRQKASADYRNHGTCQPLFRRTALFLAAFGLPFSVVFSLFAPKIFSIYLGPDWREAGEVARWLAPMLLLRLVSSPLSTVFFFAQAQRNDAAIMFAAFILCGTLVMSGAVMFTDPMAVIVGFSIAYSLIYLVQLVWSYRLARGTGR